MKTEIHAVQFPKTKFKKYDKILKWLEKHDMKPNLIEDKPNYTWVNITPKKKYKSFIVKKLDDGILLVIGYLK
jgi:hypothetical protein